METYNCRWVSSITTNTSIISVYIRKTTAVYWIRKFAKCPHTVLWVNNRNSELYMKRVFHSSRQLYRKCVLTLWSFFTGFTPNTSHFHKRLASLTPDALIKRTKIFTQNDQHFPVWSKIKETGRQTILKLRNINRAHFFKSVQRFSSCFVRTDGQSD